MIEAERQPYFHFGASLRVMGCSARHSEIAQVLNIEPTSVRIASDASNSTSSGRNGKDVWVLSSPLAETDELDLHLQWLWERCKDHEGYIRELATECDVDVFCGYRSNCDQAGFELSPQSLDLMSRLGVRMSVSVIVT